MTINELIEQIGGRKRLEEISKFHSGMVFPPSHDEIELMARALLSVLDAQEKPFMYAIADCNGEAYFDEICVDSDGGLLSDVVDSLNDSSEKVDIGYSVVPLYTIPPAASVPEWSNAQCVEFLTVAFRHCEISGDIEMDDIRLGVKMANAAASAPGDKK